MFASFFCNKKWVMKVVLCLILLIPENQFLLAVSSRSFTQILFTDSKTSIDYKRMVIQPPKVASSFSIKSNDITTTESASITTSDKKITKNLSKTIISMKTSIQYTSSSSKSDKLPVSYISSILESSEIGIRSSRKSNFHSTTSRPLPLSVKLSSLICPSVIIISPICSNAPMTTMFSSMVLTSTPTLSSYTVFSSYHTMSSSHIIQSLLSSEKTLRSTSISTKTESSLQPSKSTEQSSSKKDLSTMILPSLSSRVIPISSGIPIIPPIDQCDVVITEFANAMTNFTQCVFLNFHPMRVCKNCFKVYDALVVQHRNISHTSKCYDALITDYNVQYQIVPRMYQSLLDTWSSLDCEKCYDRDSPDILSKDFLKFLRLHNETRSCFYNFSTTPPANATHPNSTTNLVCLNCKEQYQSIQNNFPYYKDDVGDESVTNWCADINAAVNETRHLWSETYHCGRVERDLESIIALTIFFCFLPVIFYIGAKLHSDVKERKNANRNNYDSD